MVVFITGLIEMVKVLMNVSFSLVSLEYLGTMGLLFASVYFFYWLQEKYAWKSKRV